MLSTSLSPGGWTGAVAGRGSLISASWLSAPLAAGIHRVRVLIDLDDPSGGNSFSRCVGSGSDARRQSRLIVKEIRSTP